MTVDAAHPLRSLQLFFFNDTATTEIYTLSLHDALPISNSALGDSIWFFARTPAGSFTAKKVADLGKGRVGDRKSTRLNSSHGYISYAVFCLKKKKKNITHLSRTEYACTTNWS